MWLAFLLLLVSALGDSVRVRVGKPVSIVDGRSLRIDIKPQLDGTEKHKTVEVETIHACSAVDMPMIAYDRTAPERTGCRSPGYRTEEIYSPVVKKDPAGSLATKFRVRQRGHSIFLRRRLVDLRSPIVYLQIVVRSTRDGALRTVLREYRVPEKILSIGDPEVAGDGDIETKHTNFLGVPGKDDGKDDQRVTISETFQENGPPGAGYGILFIMVVGLCIGGVGYLKFQSKERKATRRKSDDHATNYRDLIKSWVVAGESTGAYRGVATV